jgi:G3E family GTPase
MTILTGFLGSGKTTLLNQLLRAPKLRDAAVLVNEFGEIGIDHLLVRHASEELVLMESGCVCCTLRGDLVTQLGKLFAQRKAGQIPAFSRVVLETTGLADPAPIVQTLMSHPELSEQLYLDGILCTVDAQHAEHTLATHPESPKQLSVSDRVLITKADLVPKEQLARVRALVHAMNPEAEVREAARGEVDPSFVMAMGHLDTRRLQAKTRVQSAHQNQHGRIRSLAVTLPTPVDFKAFSLWVAMLTQLNGERVVRLKAVVSARGEETPIAVQAVQHVVYPPLNLPATSARVTSCCSPAT